MTEAADTLVAPRPTRSSRLRRIARRGWRWTVSIFAVIGFLTVLRAFTCDVSMIASGSMAPTLQGNPAGGDMVLTEKVSYWVRGPHRWEVVAFTNSEGLHVMKRVIALPGESIGLRDHRPLIDGRPIEPPPGVPRIHYYAYGNLRSDAPHDVGSGYFLLGDDSADSNDSRFEGSISRDQLRGRAWLIVWPLHRIGFVR